MQSQFLSGSGVHRVGLDLVFSMFSMLDTGGALFIVHLFCVVLSRAHFSLMFLNNIVF